MNAATLRERTPVLPVPLDRAEARVAIARDVIKHVQAEVFRASRGVYFGIGFGCVPEWAHGSFESIVLAIRNKGSRAQCNVCAIGAATISAIGLYDDADPLEEDWGSCVALAIEEEADPEDHLSMDSEGMRKVLGRWFTFKQLDLIECAFECKSNFRLGDSTLPQREKAAGFGCFFANASDRLIAIFQNIIDNDGTFRPGQKVLE